ncbi:alkaline phosphatase family protein [Alteromonas flava]|uniref:alkaline phosphatase family protein n=1 Tax=Alteromonas flava TaxID=2048003 RepID=UPI000C2844A2|nr:alkaline phosphatase family protein [Alteromonas flava]
MSSAKKVILLEFNELCPPLLKKFITEGELPNFKKLYDNSIAYTTDACCDVEYLEPWIQWVTLHTGLPYEKHQVFRLGQAKHLSHKSVWDILSENGLSSWLCGSMNISWDSNDEKITALPDPWSVDVKASPIELQEFYEFVRANVQEHTNEKFKLSKMKLINFMLFMFRHGLSVKTVLRGAKLVGKQVFKADDNWKKATILDWLQLDVFKYIYKKKSPAFATFFSNSTAHFQHKFWRYMDPESFTLKPSEEEVKRFGSAILYAYKNHDRMIGEIFDLADQDTTIILASALSQQPFTAKDADGGRRFYRPNDITKIANTFALQGVESIAPVMSHQFHIICDTPQLAQENFEILSDATLNDERLFSLRLEGKNVFGGCCISRPIDMNQLISVNGHSFKFGEVFYLADNIKSGMHNPHGVFWVYHSDQKQKIVESSIPLEQTMPIILEQFGIAPPGVA